MMKNELTRRSLLDLGTTSPYPTLDMVITTNVKRSINVSRREFTISRREGCLSLPGQFAEVERPAECSIKYIDYNGKEKKLKANGLLATCIQHEIDHLNGILFIDYLSKLKKDMIIKKLVKHKKEIERVIV